MKNKVKTVYCNLTKVVPGPGVSVVPGAVVSTQRTI